MTRRRDPYPRDTGPRDLDPRVMNPRATAPRIPVLPRSRGRRRATAFGLLGALIVAWLPLPGAAQTDCAQMGAHVERLRQHVEQQRARGVASGQLNADIEIHDRWARAYASACRGGTSPAPGATGRRQQTLDEAQRVLGLMNRMGALGGTAPGGNPDFERELAAQAEAEASAREAARREDARRRGSAVNPFAPAGAPRPRDNPFARPANAPDSPAPGSPATPDIPQRVAGQCPPAPARGRIDVELRSAKGLTCRYTAPKSFCLRYADHLVGHQPGVASATDPDPMHVCQMLFPA